MSSTYTVRLGAGKWSSPSDFVVHTAQAGLTTVIRDIVIANQAAVEQDIYLYISDPGANNPLVLVGHLPAVSSVHLELRQVLEPGEALRLSTTGIAGTYLVTGYQLTGRAP